MLLKLKNLELNFEQGFFATRKTHYLRSYFTHSAQTKALSTRFYSAFDLEQLSSAESLENLQGRDDPQYKLTPSAGKLPDTENKELLQLVSGEDSYRVTTKFEEFFGRSGIRNAVQITADAALQAGPAQLFSEPEAADVSSFRFALEYLSPGRLAGILGGIPAVLSYLRVEIDQNQLFCEICSKTEITASSSYQQIKAIFQDKLNSDDLAQLP